MYYPTCFRKWSILGGFAILGLVLFVKTVISENALCLRCDRIPDTRDCDRIIQCGAHESCYNEGKINTSGILYYNSGCLSKQLCPHRKRRDDVSMARDTSMYQNKADDFREYQRASQDLIIYRECCNSSAYCNRNTPVSSTPAPTNRTYCLSCPNVVQPTDCDFTVLCNPGEVCYTELFDILGESRYRLGCIPKAACANTQSPAVVGKKRLIVDSTGISKYCGKCCDNDYGNCNWELCAQRASIQPNTKVMELVNPPMRTGYCTDLFPDACALLVIQNPNVCKEPQFSHYGCREFCGTCVNPAHNIPPRTTATTATTTTTTTITTTSSSIKSNTKDCYYDSKRYMGSQSTTESGKRCLNWADVYTNVGGTGFPDTSIGAARNHCRDPVGHGRLWCITSTNSNFEFCSVPFCQDCFYQGHSSQYSGYVSVDKDNNTCLPWTNYTSKFGIHIDNFPDGSTENAKNYCRDPFHSGTPMCFSANKLNPCNVPVCPHACADDIETNCALVQQYVCKYEYTSITLCPKSCHACGFGLMPPVQQGSLSTCVDNPDASCKELQAIICPDPDASKKLCPKTCNKC